MSRRVGDDPGHEKIAPSVAKSANPTPWSDALSKLRAMGTRGTTNQGNPIVTNREASGLILFARAAAAYGRDHGAPGLAFESWYPLALTTLGWLAPGDKFIMSEEHQLSTTAPVDELWHNLQRIAERLDEARVPLAISAVGSPSGTDATYKKLAADAWQVMQAADPSSAHAVKPTTAPPRAPSSPSSPAELDAQRARDLEAQRSKKKDSGSGLGALALGAFLLLVFADDDDRNDRRRR